MWLTWCLLCWSCLRVHPVERHREDNVFCSHLMSNSTQEERKTLLHNKRWVSDILNDSISDNSGPCLCWQVLTHRHRSFLPHRASRILPLFYQLQGCGSSAPSGCTGAVFPTAVSRLVPLATFCSFSQYSKLFQYHCIMVACHQHTTASWKLGWWSACFIIKSLFN